MNMQGLTMPERHTMKLISTYFQLVKEGKKRVEFRLFDEKRSQIRIGDEIRFICQNQPTEIISFVVSDVIRSTDFSELLKEIPASLLGVSKQKQLRDLSLIYENELQKQYGVVAIFLRENNERNPHTIKH